MQWRRQSAWCERPAPLIPEAMEMSGPITLPQPGSVFMSVAHVITKSHAPGGGLGCPWSCVDVRGLCWAGLTPRMGHAEELALVAWVKESWWTDHLSCPPGSDPRLWVSPPQHLPRLWANGVHDGASHAEHSFRLSLTQDNSRISERSFLEGPVLMVYPEARAQPDQHSLQLAFASKTVGAKGYTVCHTIIPVPLWPTNTWWSGRKDGGAEWFMPGRTGDSRAVMGDGRGW